MRVRPFLSPFHMNSTCSPTSADHCFVLSSDSLTFQSTDYGTYERFSEVFLEGLALVHKEVALAFTDRVGLRYLDHVFPKAADSLALYLASGVQGLSAQLGGQPVHSYSEALNAVGNVMLRARVVIQNGGLGFPPDLRPQGMAVQQRFQQAQGKPRNLGHRWLC